MEGWGDYKFADRPAGVEKVDEFDIPEELTRDPLILDCGHSAYDRLYGRCTKCEEPRRDRCAEVIPFPKKQEPGFVTACLLWGKRLLKLICDQCARRLRTEALHHTKGREA